MTEKLTVKKAEFLLIVCGLLTAIIYIFSFMFTAVAAWVVVVVYCGVLLIAGRRSPRKPPAPQVATTHFSPTKYYSCHGSYWPLIGELDDQPHYSTVADPSFLTQKRTHPTPKEF